MRSSMIVLAMFGVAVQGCATNTAPTNTATAAALTDAPPAYARSAKDTLRFHEVTSTEVRITTPQGDVTVPVEHDATIGVVFLPGDTARAWYEKLALSATSPAGVMAPETGPALRQPFLLNVDGRGKTRVITAPKFPASFEGITDLAHQFDDFFLRLPAQPLKLGLAWTDTSTRTDSGGGKWMQSSTVAQYRVDRDTMVAGEAAMVVLVKQQSTINTEGPVPGQDMRIQSQMSGGDEGWFLFAPKSGRMLGRQRKGSFSGESNISGAAGSMNLSQTMTYTNRIDLIR